MAGAGRNPSSLERMGLEGPPHLIESLVPTPLFSGLVGFNTPNAISFAPATAKFATPMTRGTLMADFAAEPQALRDWDDVFFTSSFTELVITWPGLEDEWKISMANVVGGRNYISRAELARLVMDQFTLFTSTAGERSWSSPEWKFGEVSDTYSVKNTCLAFLWSPAPGVWQPAFRVRKEPSVS